MLGERSGKRYRLGDRLHVKLVRADLETGRIDFVLGEGSRTAAVPVVKPELGKKASPKKRY
jgi:ribonuclease R